MGVSFGEVCLEAVEAGGPQLPIRLQPGFELDQRSGLQAVEPALSVGTDCDKAGLP
jgi:hypothetical protein